MAFDKIDNKDVSLQIEKEKIDVWVPDGIAKQGNSVSKIYTYGDEMSMVFGAENTVKCRENTAKTAWEYYLYSYKQSKALYTTGRTPGSSAGFDQSLVIGPILFETRMSIPVTPGARVKLNGGFDLNAPSLQQIDENGNVTLCILRIDIWGIYTTTNEEDNEIEESLNIYNYSSPRINRQNLPGSEFQDTKFMQNFNLSGLSEVLIPEGISKLLITISIVSSNTGAYIDSEYFLSPKGSTGAINGNNSRVLASFPKTNPFRVEVYNSEIDDEVVPNILSSTKFAFKNRAIFANIFPLFDYFNVPNSNFADDFSNWEGATSSITISTVSPHTAGKCVRVINNGQIFGPAISASPGERIYMSSWIRNIDFSGAGGLRIQARTGSVWSDISSTNPTIANSQWVRSETTAVVPSGADAIRLRMAYSGTGTIYFDDIEGAKLIHDSEMKFMGTPDLGTNIEIYEWNGQRGALIKSDSVVANQSKTIDISSMTGMIEVVKPGAVTLSDYGVYKEPSQTLVQNVYTKITGFLKRSDMPGTVMQNDSFLIQYSGQVIFSLYLDFYGDKGKYNKKIGIFKNGVLLKEFTSELDLSGISGQTEKFSVVAGDLITFHALSNSTVLEQRRISEASHFEMKYINTVTVGNDFYIESVVAKNWEELESIQNNFHNVRFQEVIDEVVSIKLDRSESDAGLMTITFSSDSLDPRVSDLIQIGKIVRVLGRHYGENDIKPIDWAGESLATEIMRAKIKRVEVIYDKINPPQLVITAQDVYEEIDSVNTGVAFDTFEKYGYIYNSLGIEVFVNNVNWSGNKSYFTNNLSYPAVYKDDLSLMDSLIITRNSLKSYLYINSKNQLIIKNTAPVQPSFVITDGSQDGDFSMSDIKLGIDTDAIINTIEIEENSLDYDDFNKRVVDNSKIPNIFTEIKSKQKIKRYGDLESAQNYGTKTKKFQVVRGTGSYEDITGNIFGPGYDTWAKEILDNNNLPLIRLTEISVPIKNSYVIKQLSELEILNTVLVAYQSNYYLLRVKKISYEIKAGKWICNFKFYPNEDQTYW